jgi:hypothetical protein
VSKKKTSTNTGKKKNATAKKVDVALSNVTIEHKKSGAKWALYILANLILTLIVGLPFALLSICALLFAIAKIALPPLVEAMSEMNIGVLRQVVMEQVSRGWLIVSLIWLGLGLGLMMVFFVKKIEDYAR